MQITNFSQVQRVCIMRLSAIGDILNLVPCIQHVLKCYPHLEITWIIGKGEYTLFQHLGKLHPQLKFEVFDKKTSYWQARKQLRALSQQPFDLLFHLQTSLRSNLLVSFVRAQHKVGFCKERSFEGHGWVVNQQIATQRSMHVLHDYFDQFARLMTEQEVQEFVTRIPDTAELYRLRNTPELTDATVPHNTLYKQQQLQPLLDLGVGQVGSKTSTALLQPENRDLYELLVQVKQAGEQPIALVSPASSAVSKNWYAEGYEQVIQHLLDKGCLVLISGSKNPIELGLVTAVASKFARDERVYNLAGRTNLAELVIFTQLADLVVSPDSGPMHLASVLGIPTIGLFATLNPFRSGPIQSAEYVVSVYHQQFYGQPLQFSPAQLESDLRNWRKRPQGEDLMRLIKPEQVIARIEQLWKVLEL